MEFEDKIIRCVRCGSAFVFTAEQQQGYVDGQTEQPTHCMECRREITRSLLRGELSKRHDLESKAQTIYSQTERYRLRSLVVLGLYKLAGLCSGTAFGFMGYKLFMAGVFEKAGQLEGAYGAGHLLLKQAAPGTFFALFGCIIIAVTVWRRLELNLNFRMNDDELEIRSEARHAAAIGPSGY